MVIAAGVTIGTRLMATPPDDFDRAFAVNTRSPWSIAKAAYPALVMESSGGNGRGCLDLGGATHDDPRPYAPSKSALVMLVRQLTEEWGPTAVRCNCVSPGAILTGMTEAIRIGMANLVYNFQRCAWLDGRAVPA